MKTKLGIFTAEFSLDRIKNTTEQMEEECTFDFFPYTSMHHLFALYKEHAHKFDGLLFSGLFPYKYIITHLGAPYKPHAYFEIADRDIYKVLLKIYHQNPDVDIRRIYIDNLTLEINWAEVFGDDEAIPMDAIDLSMAYTTYSDNIYSKMFEKYQQLWNDGEADYIVTRLTNLVKSLEEEGISYEVLFPSPASMIDTIERLLYEIQSSKMEESFSAVGIIQLGDKQAPEQMQQLMEYLHKFNLQQGSILILRQNKQGFEIATTNKVLYDITNEYSSCLLTNYLKTNCDIAFSLGWGLGVDIMQAQQNASRALKESKRNKKRNPYLVTEQDELIGPLIPGKSFTLSTKPSPSADAMAKKLGITPSNMQKLLTIQQRNNNLRLSRKDLSIYLNVTLRTANRILTKLSDIGAANIVATEQGISAGRPMAIYELSIDKLSPQDL